MKIHGDDHASWSRWIVGIGMIVISLPIVASAECTRGEKEYGVWSEDGARATLEDIVQKADKCTDEKVRILADGYLCVSPTRSCKTEADNKKYGCDKGQIRPKIRIELPKEYGGKVLSISKCNTSTVKAAIKDVFSESLNGKGVSKLTQDEARNALREAVLKMEPTLKRVADGGALTSQEQAVFKELGIDPDQAVKMIRANAGDTQKLLEGLVSGDSAAVQQAAASFPPDVISPAQLTQLQTNVSRLTPDTALAAAQVFNPEGVRSVLELQCAVSGQNTCSMSVPSLGGGGNAGSTFTPPSASSDGKAPVGPSVADGSSNGGVSGGTSQFFPPVTTAIDDASSLASFNPFSSNALSGIMSMVTGTIGKWFGGSGSGSASSGSSGSSHSLPSTSQPSTKGSTETPKTTSHPLAVMIVNPSSVRAGQTVRIIWAAVGLPRGGGCTLTQKGQSRTVGTGDVGSATIAVHETTTHDLQFTLDCGVVEGVRVGDSVTVSVTPL